MYELVFFREEAYRDWNASVVHSGPAQHVIPAKAYYIEH